ncbi:MAG: tRNA lysidine(34) synthetase TilS [Fibrobacteria bacterium]
MIDPTEQALLAWEHSTQSFLQSQSWHPAGASLLLAVSGGADSIALLQWARRQVSEHGGAVAVAHVHHGLRPAASEEQAFVAALCRQSGIPFYAKRLDPAARPARESVEMWGRRERYAFFGATAAAAGCDWILTGHHRDDLVETVFQRLGRGTGARGLQGIPFRRGNIIRPFLNRGRAEILEYLRLGGGNWREDESNADTRIDRNRYRHRYLPALRREEADLDARIFSLAMQVQSMATGIERLQADAGWLRIGGAGRTYLERSSVATAMEDGDAGALEYWLRRLLAVAIPEAGDGDPSSDGEPGARSGRITKRILLEFRRQWLAQPARLSVPISAGLALKCGNEGVYCAKTPENPHKKAGQAKKSCGPEAQRVILEMGHGLASWQWGNRIYSLEARRFSRSGDLAFPQPGEERAIFDAALFSCTLLVRTRQDGDRFSPLGLQSRSRKLKTFFNEEKVPIGARENLPLVLSDESVAWVPGYGISDFFKVSGSTSHILELVLKCENL